MSLTTLVTHVYDQIRLSRCLWVKIWNSQSRRIPLKIRPLVAKQKRNKKGAKVDPQLQFHHLAFRAGPDNRGAWLKAQRSLERQWSMMIHDDPLELGGTPFSNSNLESPLKFHVILSWWPPWRFIILERIICHWTRLFDEVIPAIDDRFRPGIWSVKWWESHLWKLFCIRNRSVFLYGTVVGICGELSQASHIWHINFPPIFMGSLTPQRLEYHSVPTSLNDMRGARPWRVGHPVARCWFLKSMIPGFCHLSVL